MKNPYAFQRVELRSRTEITWMRTGISPLTQYGSWESQANVASTDFSDLGSLLGPPTSPRSWAFLRVLNQNPQTYISCLSADSFSNQIPSLEFDVKNRTKEKNQPQTQTNSRWCSQCLHSSSPPLKSYWALLVLICSTLWPGHSSLCKIINAVSFQITFNDNVIHHPMCRLRHLYCFAISCFVSLCQLPIGIWTSLQVPFCLPFPGHSNTIAPTQLSACSHQHLTAVVAGTAFASGIYKSAAQPRKGFFMPPYDSFNYLSFPHPPQEIN